MKLEQPGEKLLKPCPFCGTEPTLVHGATDDYQIVCRGRECFGPITSAYAFSSDAIAAWNLRSPPAEMEAVAWQYSYEMWQGGWSPWSQPQFQKPTNPEWRVRPLYASPAHLQGGISDEMVERACKAADPLLFSDDQMTAHMAASPLKVEGVQNLMRVKMRAALTAALSLGENENG